MKTNRRSEVLAVMNTLACKPFDPSLDVFQTAMNQALARLGELLDLRATVLVRVNLENWSTEEAFGVQSEEGTTQLVQDFISELKLRKCAFSELTLWRYSDSLPPFCPAPRLVGKRRPRAVASIVKQHDQLAVILVAEYSALHREILADSQVLHLTTELLALTIEKHARSAELNKLEQRLEKAQRLEAVGQLAGGIAHELNNNLTAIMGYAEMAADAVLPDSATRDYVEEILDAGKRAKLIVDQILTFSRMRENVASPFNAVEAATEILPVLRIFLTPSVRLHVDLPDAALVMLGSPTELQQILIHLFKIVRDAVRKGGEVRLAVEEFDQPADCSLSHGQLHPGKYVKISIIEPEDGIAPSHLSRNLKSISTSKAHCGGAGLGFSLVRESIESLKGAMHVCSTLDEGTSLELFFPCIDEQSTSLKSCFDFRSSCLGKGELVAVVDPNATSRSMWEERVAALKYEPLGFSEISALVDWCSSCGSRPDVVLVTMDNYGCSAGASEMADGMPTGVAWIYICDGATRLPKEATLLPQRRVLRKPVTSHKLASAIYDCLGLPGPLLD